ncbi:MAG: isochorismatase family protein [Pseudomonadota bacterium]
MLIKAAESCLAIIDVQAKLVPAMHASEPAIENIRKLISGANCFDLPCLATEQNPLRLGPTLEKLGVPETAQCLSKMHFAAMQDGEISEAFANLGRNQVILTGLEAHICVMQTTAGLIERNYEVFVVADAVMTRTTESMDMALERLRTMGATIVNTEMVLFEWLERSDRPEFKELLHVIK